MVGQLDALLRRDLIAARKRRDLATVRALRSALAALDNAQAVPSTDHPSTDHPSTDHASTDHPSTDHAMAPADQRGDLTASPIAGASTGLGATEAPRSELTPADVGAILRRERDERLAAAARAEKLSAEAAALARYLEGLDRLDLNDLSGSPPTPTGRVEP